MQYKLFSWHERLNILSWYFQDLDFLLYFSNLISSNLIIVYLLPQALVYEKPGFEGDFLEIDSEIFSFSESGVDESENLNFKSIGSLKILGGLWVFTLFCYLFYFVKTILQMVSFISMSTVDLQLGRLQSARVWRPTVHTGGRRILGL